MGQVFALENPEVLILMADLTNIFRNDNFEDSPTNVLSMATVGQQGVLDRPNIRKIMLINGALSGSDLANEPGMGSSRTYNPGEMPLPTMPRHALRWIHQEIKSEVTSSTAQLTADVSPKRAIEEMEVQINETMEDIGEKETQQERVREELIRTQQDSLCGKTFR